MIGEETGDDDHTGQGNAQIHLNGAIREGKSRNERTNVIVLRIFGGVDFQEMSEETEK